MVVLANVSTQTTQAASTALTTAASVGGPVWVGWLSMLIAVLFFGSNWVPIKQYDTGDGLL